MTAVLGQTSGVVGVGIWMGGTEVLFTNTIIAENSAWTAPDCFGVINSLGHNLVGDGIACDFNTASGDQVGFQFPVDPKLGPLQDNGGPTKTHALLEGSPAIGAGDQESAPETDQRGVARPQGEGSDIGAYER